MMYSEFCAFQEELIEAFYNGEYTKAQLEIEMDQLQNEWEDGERVNNGS